MREKKRIKLKKSWRQLMVNCCDNCCDMMILKCTACHCLLAQGQYKTAII